MSRSQRLDRVLTWLRPFGVAADSSLGRRQTGWIAAGEAPCGLRPIAGRERFVAGAVQTNVAFLCEVRYREDITPEMRVAIDGRTYAIAAINEIGRRRALQLDLTEVPTRS